MLAIDSGNTRTKWAVFTDDGRIQDAGVCLNAELGEFLIPASWQPCKCAIVANVAGEGVAASITALLKKAEIAFVWAKAEAETLGLKNNYQAPETLGVDRWAAMVAAFKRYLNQPACLVVNAGTALTIDAIYQNAFIGGLIDKIVGAWHPVSSALAFSQPRNFPWRGAGLCGIRDKRWSYMQT